MEWGALTDKQFWSDVGNNAKNMWGSLQRYGQLPEEADRIAEQAFPGSARDASTKNAFRHALGTGMLAQELGGGKLGAAAAKLAGWGWELPTMLDPRSTAAQREDMRHDLNANAIGASVAQQTGSRAELVEALRRMALQSVPTNAPAAFAPSRGFLTRSEQ
jgi:hypothetical protein